MASLALSSRRLTFSVHNTLRRSYATTSSTFVPPAAQQDVMQAPRRRTLPNPESKTFYTGRAAFYDYVSSLELAIHHTRTKLKQLHLTPLPEFALKSLPPLVPVWKSKNDLSISLSTKLSAARHRRLTDLLNQLNDFRRISHTAGHVDLGLGISNILEVFERDDKEEHLRRGIRKPVVLDQYGRSYTLGKRKTSSARVWMISSQHAVETKITAGRPPSPPTTEIVVNNKPLSSYFPVPADRERILFPFKVTGLIGAYNVFAITRGGGSSGQSGAVAHGIAKGLAAHVPDIALILRRGKEYDLILVIFLLKYHFFLSQTSQT